MERRASLDTAKEIVRVSELHLDGTIRLSIAADARALSVSSLTAAGSTALLGFGLNSILKPTPSHNEVALGSTPLLAGVLMVAALIFALRAAQARPFYVSRNVISQWSDDERFGDLAPVLCPGPRCTRSRSSSTRPSPT